MTLTINDLLKIKPLFFDGGMGTEIQKKGLKSGEAPEAMNLRNPDAVKEIHLKYIEAGAGAIETNSFGGNRMRLDAELRSKVEEVNKAAAAIAIEAARNKAFAVGSVGPTGSVLEPFGDLSEEEAEDIFTEQISGLLKGGLQIILIETMMSLAEALAALRAAKKLQVPLTGVTMTFNVAGNDINTSFGESVQQCVSELINSGADFIGSNCGNGFDNMLVIGKKLKEFSSVPVLLQPNAGLPVLEGNKLIYKGSPEEYGNFAKQASGFGVEFLGGCCGTNYAHIRTAYDLLKGH